MEILVTKGGNRNDENSLALLYSRTSEIDNKKSRLTFLNSRMVDLKMKITEISKQLKDQDIEKLRKEFTELTGKKSEYEERLKNLTQSFKEKEARKTEEEEKAARFEEDIKDLRPLFLLSFMSLSIT
jgi:chromosome segregation ATPase